MRMRNPDGLLFLFPQLVSSLSHRLPETGDEGVTSGEGNLVLEASRRADGEAHFTHAAQAGRRARV